jgi:lipoyl(octanoyl) transferase
LARADAGFPAAFRSLRWRILRDPPGSAARNMAVDEALARCRRDGEGVVRIYRWRRPALSLGRNQPAVGRYDPHALASLGVEVVRRPTGGREVLHDREVTYAVAVPLSGPGSLRALYHGVNRALVQALGALGVAGAEIAAPGSRTPNPDAGACFAEPAAGEVVVGGRKLVGSAQVRLGTTLLQHGSLLLDRPSIRLDAVVSGGLAPAPGGIAGEAEGGITLRELIGTASDFDAVAATFEAALAGTFGGSWRRADGIAPDEEARARALEAGYLDPAWTWRR